ncbi:MAG: hypothetical protein JW864_11195 [Spirochaetes bacterium]|nr:hypothetical protein [Spirochaetota bacterium]
MDDSYDDLSVTADIHYYYTISAVDYSGIESYKDDYGQEGWADSASTIYTFRVVNGTAGIISTHISSSTSSQNQPDSVHKVTYASKPGSITWSASSYNTGMGETLTWGDTYIPATEMTHTEDPHLESDHFALWIKNSSSYTWNRFYYNNTDTTYTAVPLPPDSSIYYFMGFFTPRSTSTYWQTTVDYTNFWKWGDGGASYSYSQNSYGSYFVNCVGID